VALLPEKDRVLSELLREAHANLDHVVQRKTMSMDRTSRDFPFYAALLMDAMDLLSRKFER
jgi:hypothetical protein